MYCSAGHRIAWSAVHCRALQLRFLYCMVFDAACLVLYYMVVYPRLWAGTVLCVSWSVLRRTVGHCLAMLYGVLVYIEVRPLFSQCLVLYSSVLSGIALYCIVLSYVAMCCIVLYCIVLGCVGFAGSVLP